MKTGRSLAFFDSSVFVYADDDAMPVKRERAITLIREHQRTNTLVVSVERTSRAVHGSQ